MPEGSARSALPVSRRVMLRMLAGSAIGLLAGCRPAAHSGESATPNPANAVNDGSAGGRADAIVQRVADDERALVAAYDAAVAAHPDLADRLAPFRVDHVQHLTGLRPAAQISTAPTFGPPSSGPLPAGSVSAAAVAAVLDELMALERAAAAARLDDLPASPGSLARLLASISGCEASHAALLRAAT